MNFYMTEINSFIAKLRSLLKRISNSTNNQIQSHSSTCHQMIVKLIKDENLISSLNTPKFRLLSFELILYIIQILKKGSQTQNSIQETQTLFSKNKILSYLVDIKNTLSSIKQLISFYCYQKQSDDGFRSPKKQLRGSNTIPPASNASMRGLDNSLSQYQVQLGQLIDRFQQNIQNQEKSKYQYQQKSSKNNKSQQSANQMNQNLIQQMYNILQKKQKKIIELTNKIELITKQKINLQISIQKLQRQKNDMVSRLGNQISQKIEENKSLQNSLAALHQLQIELTLQLVELKDKLSKQQFISYQNNLIIQPGNSNMKIQSQHYTNQIPKLQNLTQQTIPSLKCVKPNKDQTSISSSLQKINSLKSFRSINNSQQKQLQIIQKKYKISYERNQQLYKILLCQAATIQELF